MGACALLLGALTACYDTPKPACGFACGENRVCPDGYECGIGNLCRLRGVDPAQCPGTPDAQQVDAAVDAIPAVRCPNLKPVSDGSGRQQLVLSEVAPGQFLELFNNTDADLVLADQSWGAASGSGRLVFTGDAGTVKVPARGYATVPWDAALKAERGNGELALYIGVTGDADFDVAEKLVGYVCWGDGDHLQRALAGMAGKWDGACAAALTGTAIRRLAEVSGAAAAGFLVDAAADPTACSP